MMDWHACICMHLDFEKKWGLWGAGRVGYASEDEWTEEMGGGGGNGGGKRPFPAKIADVEPTAFSFPPKHLLFRSYPKASIDTCWGGTSVCQLLGLPRMIRIIKWGHLTHLPMQFVVFVCNCAESALFCSYFVFFFSFTFFICFFFNSVVTFFKNGGVVAVILRLLTWLWALVLYYVTTDNSAL